MGSSSLALPLPVVWGTLYLQGKGIEDELSDQHTLGNNTVTAKLNESTVGSDVSVDVSKLHNIKLIPNTHRYHNVFTVLLLHL